MMEIDSIKNYIGNENFETISKDIFTFIKPLEKEYPDIENWFYNKQLKELNDRDILFIKDNDSIIGVVCLKKSENKICTFFIKENYRNKNLGTLLLNESIMILDTKLPFMTIPENKVSSFKYFIDKYNWILLDKKENNNHIIEYYYNGKYIK